MRLALFLLILAAVVIVAGYFVTNLVDVFDEEALDQRDGD